MKPISAHTSGAVTNVKYWLSTRTTSFSSSPHNGESLGDWDYNWIPNDKIDGFLFHHDQHKGPCPLL